MCRAHSWQGNVVENKLLPFTPTPRGRLDLPDVEIHEAHREHVVGEEGELVFAVRGVRLEGVPEELDVFLLLRRLEGERQVVG